MMHSTTRPGLPSDNPLLLLVCLQASEAAV